MDYVMVPVPEEHLADVKLFLMQQDMRAYALRGAPEVSAESVDALMAALNPRAREVLLLLTSAALEENHLSIGEIAASLGWPVHETSGVVHELRELVWEAIGPVMSVMTTATPDAQAGALDWYEQKVTTAESLAVVVVAAEGQVAQET